MRRITLWMLSTLSALVLLFSYHTSTSATASPTVVAESAANGTAPGLTAAEPAPSATPAPSTDSGTTFGSSATPSPTPRGTSAARTFQGDAVSTRFGDVQVQITVQSGKVVTSEVTKVPWTDHKDKEINSRAVPVLNSEAVDAQSAQIDMVSGATYTSDGYIRSLQSALDRASL